MRLIFLLWCGLCAGCTSYKSSAQAPYDLPTSAEVLQSMRMAARYAAQVLPDEAGLSRCDYDTVSRQWNAYEQAWHTGQLVLALVKSYEALGDSALLRAAERSGKAWIGLKIEQGPLTGMLRATHGGELGDLINATTITDGTPGLFTLSRTTRNSIYARVATEAGDWMLKYMKVPQGGMLYNFVDPKTGEVWKDKSPHKQHAAIQLGLFQVARPNAEGYLYLDMFLETKDSSYLQFFLAQCSVLLATQHVSGFWLDFEPNDPVKGKIHPRFNTWNAEALMKAYRFTKDRGYLEATLRTARALVKLRHTDGLIYYNNWLSKPPETSSPCGSAMAFAALLWLDLHQEGFEEFIPHIHQTARWLIQTQFSSNHTDPLLAGAYLEYWNRGGSVPRVYVRDIATLFGLRFMAAYAQYMSSTNH